MKNSFARSNNICLVFLTLFAGTVALIYMKPMLLPLIFSLFVYAALMPLVLSIKNSLKLPKSLAILISMTVLSLILAGIVLTLVNSVENFVEGTPKYKQSVSDALVVIQLQLESYGFRLNLAKIGEMIQSQPLLAYLQITNQVFAFLGNLFLVFIFTLFMMSGESKVENKSPLLKEILGKVSAYISAKFFLSLATGFLVWIVLLSFGIELAFIFAFLTLLLNFIPTIGSIIAVLLPLPIVFLQHQLGWPFFVVLGLTASIQFVIGNVIEPLLIGDSMELHPITILVCLIFWGMVWGLSGMFLAVPITAVLKIIFKRIEATRSFADIMGGKLPTS